MASLGFRMLDRHVIDGRADDVAWAGEPNLTYAQLLERVAALAGGLRTLRVRAGDDVCVTLDPGTERTLVVCACIRLGAIPGETGAVRVAPTEQGPVVHLQDQTVDLATVARAGAADPAGALGFDADGYAETVVATYADLVQTLLSGARLHP